MKLAVVTDFDGTLMHQDVGDYLMEHLRVMEEPGTEEIRRLFREKKIGSFEWIKVAYSFLEPHQARIDKLLDEVYLRDGAETFLQFCRDGGIPVTVLSDGMEYYVRRILERERVPVDRVIVNPIRFDKHGRYELGLQNDNEACRWCGCCKANVVRSMKAQGRRIVYIGDGSSDYFGSSFADWVFARGSLARYLQNDGIDYYPFESFHDVLDVLRHHLAEFEAGTAARRIDSSHPQCRFA
ncbi:MtnX-like HAD-IB family phosphatase [Paenibacillus hamazuiensis]|uniref:MtnX-like HAD-IB family phosphatase n=1 Tax=Paenibacillus hamazuiensis TaxID=2936508 RepID=UPI00200C90DC|nr:MtnX-like HAD-IB family phosphatase [Paenibacillus hamazuiensis]